MKELDISDFMTQSGPPWFVLVRSGYTLILTALKTQEEFKNYYIVSDVKTLYMGDDKPIIPTVKKKNTKRKKRKK